MENKEKGTGRTMDSKDKSKVNFLGYENSVADSRNFMMSICWARLGLGNVGFGARKWMMVVRAGTRR
jgi:hypothetical protein